MGEEVGEESERSESVRRLLKHDESFGGAETHKTYINRLNREAATGKGEESSGSREWVNRSYRRIFGGRRGTELEPRKAIFGH